MKNQKLVNVTGIAMVIAGIALGTAAAFRPPADGFMYQANYRAGFVVIRLDSTETGVRATRLASPASVARMDSLEAILTEVGIDTLLAVAVRMGIATSLIGEDQDGYVGGPRIDSLMEFAYKRGIPRGRATQVDTLYLGGPDTWPLYVESQRSLFFDIVLPVLLVVFGAPLSAFGVGLWTRMRKLGARAGPWLVRVLPDARFRSVPQETPFDGGEEEVAGVDDTGS